MAGGYLSEALVFLIRTLFGLYILIVALRFLLQMVRADFYNPLSQFVVIATNPALRLLRRFIPGFRGIDMSSVVLLLSLQMIELVLIGAFGAGAVPAPAGLLVLSIAELLKLFLYIFMVAIFIQVILSWVNPGAYNPVTVLIYRITEPLLAPARRLLPPMAGLDFSPLIVIVLLQLALILIIKPLLHLGYAWSGYLPL